MSFTANNFSYNPLNSSQLEIPPDFVCPISLGLMDDPVVDANGHTFDRNSITEWYKNSSVSPITHLTVQHKHLTPNMILKRQIIEFKETHRTQLNQMSGTQLESSLKINKINYKPPAIRVNTFETSEGVAVRIDTTELEKTNSKRHFILLVDESGSMDQSVSVKGEGDKEVNYGLTLLDIVKHSIKTLLNILLDDSQHEYYLTIITFTGDAERECVFLKVDQTNKNQFNRIIEGFRAKNTTNIWDAFRLGFQTINELNDSPIPLEHQIILFTDGVPNTHPFASRDNTYTPEKYFDCIERSLVQKNIRCRISTMGFGRDHYLDSELLSGIANKFSGNFGFISDTSMLSTTWLYIIANLIHETEISQPEILYTNKNTDKSLPINKLTNNQTRDILLKGKDIKNVRLTFYGSDKKTYVVDSTEIPSENREKLTNEWLVEKTRHQLCEVLQQILNYMDISQTKEATQVLDEFRQNVETLNKTLESPILDGYLEDIVSSGKAHDGGQLSMAFSQPSYYKEWGAHYLRSLHNSHYTKCKSNFKDRGLNYDTPEIQQSIKNMEAIFMDMPPPKASRQTTSSVQIQSNSVLYNQGGGCFAGSSLITIANGTTTPVKDIKKGDLVKTLNGSAKVICVTHIYQSPNGCLLCDLGNNSLITPYHPIMYKGKWTFPKTNFKTETHKIDRIYNFVLEKDHQIYINNILTPTFGHNLKGEVIGHPFFGSQKIIVDLKRQDGWEKGLVTLSPSDFKRNYKTNMVEKIETLNDLALSPVQGYEINGIFRLSSYL